MKRKLPTPDEISELSARGVSPQRIAARYGYSIKAVQKMAHSHRIKLLNRTELRRKFGLRAHSEVRSGLGHATW